MQSLRKLQQNVQELRNLAAEALISQDLAQYAEYRYLQGRIAAFDQSIEYIEETIRGIEIDDEDNDD